MKSDTRYKFVSSLLMIAILGGVVNLLMGPGQIGRRFRSWKADSYDSDWLVVLYAQDGSVISSWELHDKSIGSEERSDGIYFTDDDGHVVHLSGHYVYMSVIEGDWESLRSRLLSKSLGAKDQNS